MLIAGSGTQPLFNMAYQSFWSVRFGYEKQPLELLYNPRPIENPYGGIVHVLLIKNYD